MDFKVYHSQNLVTVILAVARFFVFYRYPKTLKLYRFLGGIIGGAFSHYRYFLLKYIGGALKALILLVGELLIYIA